MCMKKAVRKRTHTAKYTHTDANTWYQRPEMVYTHIYLGGMGLWDPRYARLHEWAEKKI